MKRKIIRITWEIIAVAGILCILGTAGTNDLAEELGTVGLTPAETLLHGIIGLLLFAIGTLRALTLQK